MEAQVLPGTSVEGAVRRRALADFALLMTWLAVWSAGAVRGSLAGNAW
ncbi:MAG: hypothetical protein U1F41_11265 [Burkholderiales bacterium]